MEAPVIEGLDSNVVQFVDFAQELVSKTYEICRSSDDVLKEHADIKAVTEKIPALADTLELSHPSVDPELNQLSTECSRPAHHQGGDVSGAHFRQHFRRRSTFGIGALSASELAVTACHSNLYGTL
jgi:hypothetical protein